MIGRNVMMDTVDRFDVSLLAEAGEADRLAVISPMDEDCRDSPHLYIAVHPTETLIERVKEELRRQLDPSSADDRAAFNAMISHLRMTEMYKYPNLPNHVGDAELQALAADFEEGKVRADGLFVVARGYDPALDQGVTRIADGLWKLNWTN